MQLFLAPLRGVTLAPFRRLLHDRFGGFDAALAPFAALGAGPNAPPRRLFADVEPAACGGVPTVPQVIGRDPDALRAAAAVLRDMGHARLDLNCGCPWKFVAKKGRGSGLPEDEAAFARMLEAGCEAMPGGFSVKIRLGRRTPDTLERRAALLGSFPLAALVVHPRTGEQMYEGRADEDAFAAVLPRLNAPVVYNGDVATPADALRIWARFPGIAGVMVGRGACANPALFAEIRAAFEGRPPPFSGGEKRERIAAFADELAGLYAAASCGPAPLLGRLKELWGYLHASFETGCEGLRRIQRARTPDELFSAVRRLTESRPSGSDGPLARGGAAC